MKKLYRFSKLSDKKFQNKNRKTRREERKFINNEQYEELALKEKM